MSIKSFHFVTVNKLIAFKKTFVKVVITQDYMPGSKMGHYRGYIKSIRNSQDDDNAIFSVFQTHGAPHDGKVDDKTCQEEYDHWYRHL